jgi:LacI family transcriptional regulator
MIAYGIIAGIKAAGAHVPNNISVVGIDNIPFNNITTPGLTTVDVSAGMLAQRAAQFIVHLRQRDDDLMRTPLSMKPELVIRGTVRRI